MKNNIKKIFAEVPETYEIINHILTCGFDIVWRRKASKIALEINGSNYLDICTGTGETAVYLKRFSGNGSRVYAADFSMPMMQKAIDKPDGKSIAFLCSNVEELPFRDGSFDAVTISFATRNINLNKDVLVKTFKEVFRVLKQGGHFINLETSQPAYGPLKKIYHSYVGAFVPIIGSYISGSKIGYTYLSKTIPRFYEPEELGTILSQAGFKEVKIRRLLFGIAAIHQCIKPGKCG